MTGSQRLAAAVGKEEELTTWSRSICHLKSHPWNLKWLEKFKKFSAWDNFWGVDEMKCCSTYSSVPLYQLTWKSWPPQQHPLFAPPLLLCSFAPLFLCFWGNKGELSITISSCSGHVQAHCQIPLQLWRFWTLLSVRFLFISARFDDCLNCACRLLVVWTSLLHWRWILGCYVEKEIFLTILYKDSNVVSVWADLEGIYGVMVLGVLYS